LRLIAPRKGGGAAACVFIGIGAAAVQLTLNIPSFSISSALMSYEGPKGLSEEYCITSHD
jgi:hypothetical protein